MKQTTKAITIFMLICAKVQVAHARPVVLPPGQVAAPGPKQQVSAGSALFPGPGSSVNIPINPDTGAGRGSESLTEPTNPGMARGGSEQGQLADPPVPEPSNRAGGRGGSRQPANPPATEPPSSSSGRGRGDAERESTLERKREYTCLAPEAHHLGSGPSGLGRHVGAYFPSYKKESHPISTVNMSLYSNAYFFATVTTETSELALDTSRDVTEDDVKDFVAAAKAAGTRPSLSIGGWTGSVYFSSNVATALNRTAFVKSIADFYEKYGFEGVDTDWLYPSTSGIGCNTFSPDDTTNLVLFLRELRASLPCASLSMAVSMTGMKDGNGERATDMTALAEALDYVNIMTYDAWGSWSNTTGPLGPLSDTCPNDGLSVKNAVQIFLDQNFKASQLVVGIPAYGRSSTLLHATLTETTVANRTSLFYQSKNTTVPEGGATDDQPGTDVCGAETTYGGTWLVSELVSRGDLSHDLSAGGNGFTRYFDECSGTPFLYNKDTLKFIAYDDRESSVKKAEYAKSMGLKGIFFFDTAGALPVVVSSATIVL